jgi:putative spermidine/putrescine transport system permease protein
MMRTRTMIREKSQSAPSIRKKPQSDAIQQIGGVFAWLSVMICLVPIPLIGAVATTRQWRSGFWAEGFTTQWLAQSWERISPHAWYSFQLALFVLLLNVLIGLPAAWLIARRRFSGRRLLLSLSMVPIAIPGIALALSLILTYPRLRGDGYLLIVGHVLYTLPFFIGVLTPVLGTAGLIERERVAQTLGARFIRRFVTIVIPTIRSALLAGAIMVLTLSMGEFNVSFFLFTPTEKTLPVELYDSYVTGRLEVAAGMTVWFLLFIIPATIVLERFGGGKVGQA